MRRRKEERLKGGKKDGKIRKRKKPRMLKKRQKFREGKKDGEERTELMKEGKKRIKEDRGRD